MKIRGWLIIGAQGQFEPLDPELQFRPHTIFTWLPNAAEAEPGQWTLWIMQGIIMVIVCVEIPVA